MDRHTKKLKDRRPKAEEKDKLPLFPHDLKSIKENFKKEFLKTVKINNSFRVKGPRATKVILNSMDESELNCDESDLVNSTAQENIVQNNQKTYTQTASETLENTHDHKNNDYSEINKTFIQNDDFNDTEVNHMSKQFEGYSGNEPSNDKCQMPESINEIVIINNEINKIKLCSEDLIKVNETCSKCVTKPEEVTADTQKQDCHESDHPTALPKIGQSMHNIANRNRKLSLDNTILSRKESWSQSEINLHSVGKSPLERKSSFFRKKLDKFFKNTTEIFKKQAYSVKPENSQRRGSISLQCLNNPAVYENINIQENQSPVSTELDEQSKAVSESSLAESHSSHPSFDNSQVSLVSSQTSLGDTHLSQPTLYTSQPLVDSAHGSFNDVHTQDNLLNTRAISFSSGLDSVRGANRRMAKRANRVTWAASDNFADYMKRVVQDRRQKDISYANSCQELGNLSQTSRSTVYRGEGKGRRLSYQRAVSGEDPVLPSRYHDASNLIMRSKLPELNETRYELVHHLTEFSRSGVPELKAFVLASIPDNAMRLLTWLIENPTCLEEFYDWKKLNSNEESRQAVIRELVTTEVDHIKHLQAIADVFIAAAHALQDAGMLLDIDTERLFTNIPDVLNASLYFWDAAIVPMLSEALDKETIFNSELMYFGFYRFRDLFNPYEKYVSEQSKALDYLRSLSTNTDFMTYLTWCHSQKSCNRLQLSDIMAKPMQRLTKYSLILRRIIAHTDTEPERTSLIVMESFSKNYVLDVNRTIRQKEELEKLDAIIQSIDVYEIDFKDDDIDRYFRCYTNLNLRAPMVGCLQNHSRTLVYQGDLRFKDNLKETRIDVRAILLTDMLLICKKLSPKSQYSYKLIRPKYMVDKMMHFLQFKSGKQSKEVACIIFVMIDEVGSAYHSFALYEPSKDSNPNTMKIWEQKIKEAKLTYDLSVWFAKNPSRDLSELDNLDSSSDYTARPGVKQSSEDLSIEREARERVAAMLHRTMGVSTDYDISQASMNTDSFEGEASATSGIRTPGMPSLRHPMQRNSTGGSSRNSRLSSFQQSTSAASHDEPQAGPSRYTFKCGSSVEHLIPPQNPEDVKSVQPIKREKKPNKQTNRKAEQARDTPLSKDVTSITVNVLSESESETIVPRQSSLHRQPSRTPSINQNMLRVQPQSGAMALVHSLPDLTIDPLPRHFENLNPQSASDKLYQEHQEHLNRNRLSARPHSSHLLTPDHRGTSYPPPSPNRGSLKRGLAFSYSFKNPPLSKMGHVNSQSQQLNVDAPSTSSQQPKVKVDAPSTSSQQPKVKVDAPSTSSQQPKAKVDAPSTSSQQPKAKVDAPSTSSQQPKSDKDENPKPSTSTEKKSSKSFTSRNKSGKSSNSNRKDAGDSRKGKN